MVVRKAARQEARVAPGDRALLESMLSAEREVYSDWVHEKLDEEREAQGRAERLAAVDRMSRRNLHVPADPAALKRLINEMYDPPANRS